MNSNVTGVSSPPTQTSVALVCTVFNEASSIYTFLESLTGMTQQAEETIIVDGGSTDETAAVIRKFIQQQDANGRIQLIVDPSCNIHATPGPIARGRNVAILHATKDIIACTDAGCVLDRQWLEKITAPFSKESVDVVAGWYVADARSYVEKCIALVSVPPPGAVNPASVIPSSRSVAFRKSCWARVGGYPEVSYWGEDTSFVIQLRKAGCHVVYEPDAVVYWRMKNSVAAYAKLIFRYGFGDGFSSILVENVARNMLKLGISSFFIVCGFFLSSWYFSFFAAFLLVVSFNGRLKQVFMIENVLKLPLVMLLKLVSDGAYVLGYTMGKLRSVQPVRDVD